MWLKGLDDLMRGFSDGPILRYLVKVSWKHCFGNNAQLDVTYAVM